MKNIHFATIKAATLIIYQTHLGSYLNKYRLFLSQYFSDLYIDNTYIRPKCGDRFTSPRRECLYLDISIVGCWSCVPEANGGEITRGGNDARAHRVWSRRGSARDGIYRYVGTRGPQTRVTSRRRVTLRLQSREIQIAFRELSNSHVTDHMYRVPARLKYFNL